jgi:hypothetical protein
MKTIIRTFTAGHKTGQKEVIGTCETWNEFLLIVEKYDPLFIDDETIKDESGNELDFYKHEDEFYIDLRDYSFKAERTNN